MRKVSKNQSDPNMLFEYNFSKGVRAHERIWVWAPLVGFHWAGSECQIADGTWIRLGSSYRDYEDIDVIKYWLSEGERDQCRGTKHWLAFTHARSDELSTSAKINSFLIALWIVQPTETHVPFRFEIAESLKSGQVARVLGRFQWIEGQAAEEVKDQDLDDVARILTSLQAVYAARRRLKNALILTFRGCVASDWQSAFICFSAAAEAILTYSSRPGLTDRLAHSYAKLVCGPKFDRELAYDRFKRLYSVRSDIVHGRAYDRNAPSHNLSDLAEFSDILRRLWGVVLKSQEVRTALDGDDRQRGDFLAGL